MLFSAMKPAKRLSVPDPINVAGFGLLNPMISAWIIFNDIASANFLASSRRAMGYVKTTHVALKPDV